MTAATAVGRQVGGGDYTSARRAYTEFLSRPDLYVYGKSDPRLRPAAVDPPPGRPGRKPGRPGGQAQDGPVAGGDALTAPPPAGSTPEPAPAILEPPAATPVAPLRYCGGCDYVLGSHSCVFICGPTGLDDPGSPR